MVNTICICGAGTMGTGIAQVAASAGFKTILFDIDSSRIEKSKTSLIKNFRVFVEKERITDAEREQALSLLVFTSNIEDCKANFIIEAIIEDEQSKIDLFKKITLYNNDETIYTTNTSSISISSLASRLTNTSKFAGMHFFNPAPMMKLVEVVKGENTGDDVIEKISTLCRRFGKTPVTCNDVPGFIVNRVARPYYLEALKLLESGETNIEIIDKVMEASGFKMGPFKLMDLIGMDVNYSVSSIIWHALGEPGRLTPSTLQKQKVDVGELGRKTGQGFYNY